MTWPTLHSPWALVLLAAIPAALLWRRRRWTGGIPLPGISELRAPRGWRAGVLGAQLPLRIAVLVLLTGALARPQLGLETTEEKRKGVDIMLALDTSYSMLAKDYQPNRITGVRELATRFVDQLQSDRVGLVVFSGSSFTQSPLTFDYEGLKGIISKVDIGMVAASGTAIGDSLANCVYRFTKEAERTKVIVLLTDGEQTAGHLPAVDGARIAQSRGIRVYAVGVGSPQGAPIPLPPPHDDQLATDEFGRPVVTHLDEATLAEIARVTGGQYYRAETEERLGQVLATIAQLEKSEVVVKRSKVMKEQAQWLVAPAALLLALEFVAFRGWLRVMG